MPNHRRRRLDGEVEGSNSSILRALVVDDSEHDRVYVATLLRRIGFAVTVADDGVAAKALVTREVYDLLVIDCEMPRMNGIELVTQVRASENCCDGYALMLTGREDIETRIAALRAGFDDFLLKSMSETEILAKVGAARRLIARQRRLDTAVRELYGLATRDELTGLFNRRFFFDDAARRLAEGAAIGVVLFDLDDFKRINDTFGHLAGDRILRDIGALFLRRTRYGDLIARYGGDEFVMLVASALPSEIERLSTRLAEEIATMQWTIGSEALGVGVSCGFATSVLLEEPSVERLIEASDRDLYKNKWMRANPALDPSLYEYPSYMTKRDSALVELRFPRDKAVKDAST